MDPDSLAAVLDELNVLFDEMDTDTAARYALGLPPEPLDDICNAADLFNNLPPVEWSHSACAGYIKKAMEAAYITAGPARRVLQQLVQIQQTTSPHSAEAYYTSL